MDQSDNHQAAICPEHAYSVPGKDCGIDLPVITLHIYHSFSSLRQYANEQQSHAIRGSAAAAGAGAVA